MGAEKKETPDPGTAAKDGRRTIGADASEYRTDAAKTQAQLLGGLVGALSVERLEVYGSPTEDQRLRLARYLLNMALCESLYSPLQFCEIALRNAVHQDLTRRLGTESWFNDPGFILTEWARGEVTKAQQKITQARKPVTPGRVVAELQLGFWTSLFEAHYEQNTPFLPKGIKGVFPYLPKSQHNRKDLKAKLEEIRTLRNRVFHHERIVHWGDLGAKHALILQTIGWINPDLEDLARDLDRFAEVRNEGLGPWLGKLDDHWDAKAGGRNE